MELLSQGVIGRVGVSHELQGHINGILHDCWVGLQGYQIYFLFVPVTNCQFNRMKIVFC